MMKQNSLFVCILSLCSLVGCSIEAPNPCDGITCGGFGECSVSAETYSALCSCDEGYRLDPMSNVRCILDPCHLFETPEHAECYITENNKAAYRCIEGYVSKNGWCISEACENVDCSNLGNCQLDANNEAVCVCKAGYKNDNENRLVCVQNYCNNINCSGHGTCVDDGTKGWCDCDKEYDHLGVDVMTCVLSCYDTVCGEHQICSVINGAFECSCEEGFEPAGEKACTPINNDHNGNYMIDYYDVAPDKTTSCRYHDECKDFCDTFIGKCSQKCTDDSQCISEDYFCRPDGRCAPKVFETVWEVSEKNKTLTFPSGTTCDYTIDWGDGNTEKIESCPEGDMAGALLHTYDEAGTYHIKVTGTLDGWNCLQKIDTQSIEICANLVSVESFGPVGLGEHAFIYTYILTNLSQVDIPDSSKFKSAYMMFYHAEIFDGDISKWDTSNVTNMYYMFSNAFTFNQNVNNWDVRNVEKFIGTFRKTNLFNQELNGWQTSKAKSFNIMFEDAKAFNQPLDNWKDNVSNITNLDSMFIKAAAFDQSLKSWVLNPKVTYSTMFSESGLSQENFCDMMQNEVFAAKPAALGLDYTCE